MTKLHWRLYIDAFLLGWIYGALVRADHPHPVTLTMACAAIFALLVIIGTRYNALVRS